MERRKIILRQKEVKLRKSFLPSLIIIIILWVSLTATIYFIDPASFGAVPLFFILSFLALTFTLSFLLSSGRRGILWAGAATLFLVLRYFGVGNILNLTLLLGLLVTLEIYFYRK